MLIILSDVEKMELTHLFKLRYCYVVKTPSGETSESEIIWWRNFLKLLIEWFSASHERTSYHVTTHMILFSFDNKTEFRFVIRYLQNSRGYFE